MSRHPSHYMQVSAAPSGTPVVLPTPGTGPECATAAADAS